ncbi:MAG TPA: hypothetical protein VFT55_01055, partial [Planctomycetota bacterium]|nr:hypothetical protein [Planctomycetota bacterium]
RLQLPELGEEPRGKSDDRTALFCAPLPVVGTVDAWSIPTAARDGDGWLVSTWDQLLRVTAKETLTIVARDRQWPSFALRWRGDLLVGIGNAVHRVDSGRFGEAMPFRAACADTMGDDLLLVRSLPAGLPELQGRGREVLVRRRPAGEETTLLELPAGGTNKVAVARDRSRALLTGSNAGGVIEPGHAGPWLAVVDLGSPSFTRLPGWVSIDALAAADAGWIVTGTPGDGPSGIWLVSPAGEREPLVTGNDVQGLGATDGILTFARTSHGKCVLRDATLAACRAGGRRCQPFGARHLEAIGEKLLAELGEAGVPRTAADLAAARTRADAIARASCDADLPKSAADVDALITAIQSQTVGPHARVVVTLLIATAAIDAGAHWVEGGSAKWSSWFGAGAVVRDTAFATLNDPRAMLVGALDDSEGDMSPLTSRERGRDGRIALIGFDAAALSARAASVVPQDLATALANADATRLAAICDEVPDNSHLRDAIYEHLAAANSIHAVEELAQRYAARQRPQATDLVAWLAAWQHRTKEPPAAREQFDAALRAVQQHPREAALYLCLGRAAKLAFPEQPVKARQCFDRILSLATRGAIAGQARTELMALDGK